MSDKSHDAEPESELVSNESESDAAKSKDAPAIARKTAKAPVKKSAPTKKRSESRHDDDDPYRAKNPIEFARQSGSELKKVVWPNWPQLTKMFAAVLVFVVFIILFVSVLDYGFGSLLMWMFGGK